MTSSHREQGRRAVFTGKMNEQVIQSQASLLQDVLLVRQYPEIKILGNLNKPGNVRIVGKAFPDFILLSSSLTLVFDAKHTDNKTKYTPLDRDIHQFANMVAVDQLNNPKYLAGYLLYWGEQEIGEFFRVTKYMAWRPTFEQGTGMAQGIGYNWMIDLYHNILKELAP